MTRPWKACSTAPLFLALTKLPFLLLLAMLSTIHCTCHLGTSITQFVEHIAMLWFQLDSSPFQKVTFSHYSDSDFVTHVNACFLGDQKYDNNTAFWKFKCQVYHASLTQILMPLQHGMTIPVVHHCPDSHYCCVIYDLAVFIADYPEQVYLSGVVQGWCPR